MAVGSFRLPILSGGGVPPIVEDWVRPIDWLPMPIIAPTDDTFVGLHAVFENGSNFCAFSFATTAGQYQVDWGDGTVTLHNSNVIAQHKYNYATYDLTNDTLCSRGYKQAIIQVTAVSGALVSCNFQKKYVTTPAQNQPYSTGFLDCLFNLQNPSIFIIGGDDVRHTSAERVVLKNTSSVTNLANLFVNFYSLQSIPLFDTSSVLNMSNMLRNCFSIIKIPLFNTSSVINMALMLSGCYSIREVPLFDTSSVNAMVSMLASCYSLQKIPLFNTSSVTNMTDMFSACFSLRSIPSLNTASVTASFGIFSNNCVSVSRIEMAFNQTTSIVNCQLSKVTLVEVFTNLTDRTATTSASINITGNWGASALTPADRLIATSKNWTLIG